MSWARHDNSAKTYVDIAGVLEELTDKLESVVAASTALLSEAAGPEDAGIAVVTDERLSDDSSGGHGADAETNYGARPVSVHLDRAGGPECVDVSLRWLGTVTRTRLGETVREAFDRAYERFDADRASVASLTTGPTWSAGMTPKLQELIRDPAAVLASFAVQLP